MTVKQAQLEKEGKALDSDQAEALQKPILEKYERQGSPYFSTARLWDDGIIDPLDTRAVLGLSLAAALNRPNEDTTYGVFRM